LKDFNFCREECNTFLGYEVESAARFSNGLPPWTGLGHDKRRTPKASLSLVLRSLTNNHRELVQAMAKMQLESGSRGGVSLSALLRESTDRMIAATVPKLRSLLNELRDHEVVIQRNSSAVGAQVLFSLPFDDRMLTKLAENANIDSDDEAEEDAVVDIEEHSDCEVFCPSMDDTGTLDSDLPLSQNVLEAEQEQDMDCETIQLPEAGEQHDVDCAPIKHPVMDDEVESKADAPMHLVHAPEPAPVGPPDAPWS
jgi:hypothetical protein